MIVKLFSVFDSKVSSYSPPLSFRHVGEATRWFADRASNKDNIGKYPADHILFEIGSFDVDTAKILMAIAPVSLGVAIEFVGL